MVRTNQIFWSEFVHKNKDRVALSKINISIIPKIFEHEEQNYQSVFNTIESYYGQYPE